MYATYMHENVWKPRVLLSNQFLIYILECLGSSYGKVVFYKLFVAVSLDSNMSIHLERNLNTEKQFKVSEVIS